MRTSDLTMVSQEGLGHSLKETASEASAEAIALLHRLDREIEAVVLSRQHPLTGLLPASTANTVHGNYGDAWVRDCVYSDPAAGPSSWSNACCS
jgi:hypothetical protein